MDGSKSGSGHPLPASDEARRDQIPEELVNEKGFGDDVEQVSQPGEAVAPDGEPYPPSDSGRDHIDAGIGDGRSSLGPGMPV